MFYNGRVFVFVAEYEAQRKHNVFLMQGKRYEPQANANHRNRNEINTLLSLRFYY